MFRQLKNIDTAFKHIKVFTIIVIVASLLLSGFVVFKSLEFVKHAQSKVYILANGKALEAISSDRKENIAVEAKDHIKTFHTLFFTLDPDEKAIQSNISKALYLADVSAKKQYDNLRENGYYANIISGNISQRISIDSIRVDTKQYPYYFHLSGKQTIIRTTSTVTRSLITEGYLRDVQQTENNPHGFLIEKWRTIENKDLKIENR